MREYLSMASRTLREGGFGFSLDIMRCRLGSRQASSMWDETYIFCPFNHGTKYSSIGFMRFLQVGSVLVARSLPSTQKEHAAAPLPHPFPSPCWREISHAGLGAGGGSLFRRQGAKPPPAS